MKLPHVTLRYKYGFMVFKNATIFTRQGTRFLRGTVIKGEHTVNFYGTPCTFCEKGERVERWPIWDCKPVPCGRGKVEIDVSDRG